MKSKRRRRYKKKKYDFILISKIALICYTAIYGLGYLTSDTSAYFSSRSEVTQTITAGIWEVPEVLVNACGEEYTIDVVPSKEVESNDENKVDCENKDENLPGGLACEDKENSPVGENKKNAAISKKDKIDCKNIDDPKDAKEINKPVENVKTIEQKNENELKDGNNEAEKEIENKADAEQPKSNDENQVQPEVKEESVDEPKEPDPANQDTTEDGSN